MCEQCVPGSLSSSPAQEPGNEASKNDDTHFIILVDLTTQSASRTIPANLPTTGNKL